MSLWIGPLTARLDRQFDLSQYITENWLAENANFKRLGHFRCRSLLALEDQVVFDFSRSILWLNTYPIGEFCGRADDGDCSIGEEIVSHVSNEYEKRNIRILLWVAVLFTTVSACRYFSSLRWWWCSFIQSRTELEVPLFLVATISESW